MVKLEDNIYEDLRSRAEQSEQLNARIARVEAENLRLVKENEILREHYALSRQRQFGTSSEKTPKGQEMLFNEAEECASPEGEAQDETITEVEVGAHTRKKMKGKREQDIAGLKVNEIRHELPESERICTCCGEMMHEMSQEVRDELKLIPVTLEIDRHITVVYACRPCGKNEIKTPIKTAPKPERAFHKGLASPSSVAFIMSQKYVEGSPLYRLELYFRRLGFNLSRQSMSNWVIAGSKWLEYLYKRMHELLLTRDIAHADETVLQVLHETERAAQAKSYMWLYRTGRDGLPPICLYEYKTTRAGEHPCSFLKHFRGYLHVDGYSGYNGLIWLILVGCWAHARRRFTDIIKLLPPELQKGNNTPAHIGRNFINKLFAIERDLKNATTEERFAGRNTRSSKVLDDYHAWLKDMKSKVTAKGKLAEAINYSLNQWEHLIAFLQDGRLEIDNNRAERSIKPFVIGRKNWLFSNTAKGAHASAVVYSIIETAKENGLRPAAYLEYLFEHMPKINLKNIVDLDTLLPWAQAVQEKCAVPTQKTIALR